MPTFAPSQIARAVVDRLFGAGDPDQEETRWQQILSDPAAASVARKTEAYVQRLAEDSEDPIARFERLTGRPLLPPSAQK